MLVTPLLCDLDALQLSIFSHGARRELARFREFQLNQFFGDLDQVDYEGRIADLAAAEFSREAEAAYQHLFEPDTSTRRWTRRAIALMAGASRFLVGFLLRLGVR